MEVLTLTIALHPEAMESLAKDKIWHSFVVDMVLLCRERSIRLAAAEQMLLIVTRATAETQHVKVKGFYYNSLILLYHLAHTMDHKTRLNIKQSHVFL